jgi:hypothetical protein
MSNTELIASRLCVRRIRMPILASLCPEPVAFKSGATSTTGHQTQSNSQTCLGTSTFGVGQVAEAAVRATTTLIEVASRQATYS